MKGNSHDIKGQSGFSMVELIIVIIIISIVASLAFMNMGTANVHFKRQNVARELKVSFERARFDSVKRHAENLGPATIDVATSSYTLNTYTNGVLETQTTNLPAGITIVGFDTATVPANVSFDKRGEVTTTGSLQPNFRICSADCSAQNSNILLVTPTGTVNLLGGDATLPAFDLPPVTTVPPTTGINNLVRL